MPYRVNADLPKSVHDALPPHAQTIYREAFNHAWEEYKNPKKRASKEDTQEETAHKVAWAAVKKTYHKVGDKWEKKAE